MTTNAKIITLTAGDKVFNTEFKDFERVGEVVERKGKLKVAFTMKETGKPYTVKLSDVWQKLPDDAPADILGAVIDQTEKRAAQLPAPNVTPEPFEPLSSDEKTKRGKLEKEYRKLDSLEQKLPFEKARIINTIRNEKLFRDTHRTFAEYAADVLGVTREYGQNLAQIGAFMEITGESFTSADVSPSINAANRFIINQNKLAETFQMKDAEMSEFAPVLGNVIGITIETATDENGKTALTAKVVDAVNAEVAEVLSEFADYAGRDIIAKAAKRLRKNRDALVKKSRARLQAKPQNKAGETCEHVLEITGIENNVLTLKCGCSFRLVKM